MKTRLRAVVVDPEVVFVASLMKADAPALVASFQCGFSLQTDDDGAQNMTANLRELKVLACPFIYNKQDKAITTVRSHVIMCPSDSSVSCRSLTHHSDSCPIGVEALLRCLGNENQPQPTNERLCDGGGSHHQGAFVHLTISDVRSYKYVKPRTGKRKRSSGPQQIHCQTQQNTEGSRIIEFIASVCLYLQISPFILNTVMTITAAMTKQREEQSKESKADVSNLWSVMNIYTCNYWFLGVDQATEVTENFRDQDGPGEGENFAAEVKVGCSTSFFYPET